VIAIEPLVDPFAAMYVPNFPWRTNITLALCPLEFALLLVPVVDVALALAWLFAGVAGCDGFAANAAPGTATRTTTAIKAIFRISEPPRLGTGANKSRFRRQRAPARSSRNVRDVFAA
jgi:hypothetical protein